MVSHKQCEGRNYPSILEGHSMDLNGSCAIHLLYHGMDIWSAQAYRYKMVAEVPSKYMTMPQAGNLQSDPALRLKPLQESDFVEACWNYSVAGGAFGKLHST